MDTGIHGTVQSRWKMVVSLQQSFISTHRQVYNILLTVSQYMLYTNPAINPIVYALMHTTFRRAFRVTFPCFYGKKVRDYE